MEYDLNLDESFDWGFTAVSADEVEQGKQQSEAINKVVEGSDNLQQQLNGLDVKLEQVLAVATKKYEDRLQEKEIALESENKDKFEKIEKMIIPLLQNLAKSSDEPYIYWPKRKEIIESQIERILKLTRG
ncbi:hypothetical protein CMI47_17210 [Candidatus Pacearchaeota archaeon]|jgi:hypothetical protein|nr:hypothetical protein [Candidatus Pacearchaeota archaeon]|tara:strand:+ start:4105 stop:4494 length:390 start_codon:yes stop_codon:yes gene_type:complete